MEEQAWHTYKKLLMHYFNSLPEHRQAGIKREYRHLVRFQKEADWFDIWLYKQGLPLLSYHNGGPQQARPADINTEAEGRLN